MGAMPEQPEQRPTTGSTSRPQSRPTATPAERLRFFLVIAAGLAVVLAIFGIVRIMQQNNSDRTYEECLERARQQAQSSQVEPDPTAPDPAAMCQRPN